MSPAKLVLVSVLDFLQWRVEKNLSCNNLKV